MPTFERPEPAEYGAFYRRYIDLVPEADLLEHLKRQGEETRAMWRGAGEEQAAFRYRPGAWSVREVVGHMADTERVMAYRALRIARGDTTPLPGFDQDAFVRHAGFDRRLLPALGEELYDVRRATLSLLQSLEDEATRRMGMASEQPTSVRALGYIIAGHELHHLVVLRERYGL